MAIDIGSVGKKITSAYTSYREKYTWHYIPVGIKADFQKGDNWRIGANVAARFMFGGKMKVYLSELDSSFNDPTVDLGNKVGWLAETPIRYRFWASRQSKRYPSSGWFLSSWELVVLPWYEYSEIGKSNEADITYWGYVIDELYEPASTTHQYGINVGLIYSF